MQGQQLLFTSIFSTDSIKTRKPVVQTEATERRDEALAYRYYYHIEIQRTRYDDVLLDLEKEFFISPCVIVKRLTYKYELVKQLVEQKPKLPRLKKLYPHMVWIPKKA